MVFVRPQRNLYFHNAREKMKLHGIKIHYIFISFVLVFDEFKFVNLNTYFKLTYLHLYGAEKLEIK